MGKQSLWIVGFVVLLVVLGGFGIYFYSQMPKPCEILLVDRSDKLEIGVKNQAKLGKQARKYLACQNGRMPSM